MTECPRAFILQFSRTVQRWSLQLKKTELLFKSSNVNSCSANPMTMTKKKKKRRILSKNGIGQREGHGTSWDILTINTVLEDNHGSINLGYSPAAKTDIATRISWNGCASLSKSYLSCWPPHCPPLLWHHCSKTCGALRSTAATALHAGPP